MRRLATCLALALALSACATHSSRVAQVHSSALTQGALGGGFLAVGIVGAAGTAAGGVAAALSDTGTEPAPLIISGVVSAVCLAIGGVLLGQASGALTELPAAQAEDAAMRDTGGPQERSAFEE